MLHRRMRVFEKRTGRAYTRASMLHRRLRGEVRRDDEEGGSSAEVNPPSTPGEVGAASIPPARAWRQAPSPGGWLQREPRRYRTPPRFPPGLPVGPASPISCPSQSVYAQLVRCLSPPCFFSPPAGLIVRDPKQR